MKDKILEVMKKYKIAVISAIIVLLIGIIGLVFINLFGNNSSIKKVNEKYYAFEYDNTWKLKDKKKNIILLKHGSGSKIIIQITELIDEYRYATMDELIDEVIYNVEEQNKGYNLISKKKDRISNYKFDGYKLLYENGKEQVMMVLFKKGDKLISVRYEATNDYFDILLDSVHNIVNNLDIKDENFDLKNSLKIETTGVNYSTSDEFDKSFVGSATYDISGYNYYVQFTLPDNFIQNDFNSKLGLYHLKDGSSNIYVTVSISKLNIYEYLDKEDSSSVYRNYSFFHEKDKKDYSDFKESLAKLESDYDSYIYKNSYNYDNAIKYDSNFNSIKYKRKNENVELIYALNNCHILVIKIKSSELPITEKFINMIKIKSVTNYASYVSYEKVDGYLVSEFKRFTDYNTEKIDLVTLKIPDKYEEIDKNDNFYLNKYFGIGYDDDMEIYNYNVHYELSKLDDDDIIEMINKVYISSVYGEAHKLSYSGDLMVGDKKFKVYDGGYTEKSGILLTNINRKLYYINKKVLFYEMANKGNFYIEINGNGKEITNEVLSELLNFTVEEKDY